MGFEEAMQQFECAIVSRGSKLGIVFASSHEVCVGEGLLTFSA